MGNIFAYLVIIAWPIISLFAFRILSKQKAILFTLLAGYLLLPVKTAFNIPFIPSLGKSNVTVLACLFCLIFIKKQTIGLFGSRSWVKLILLTLIVSPFLTVINNQYSIAIDYRFLSALSFHDAFSTIANQLLLIIPFFIGSRFFSSYESQVTLFKAIVYAGLLYSLLILVEVRLSPQLHIWLYGYFPHNFDQQYRMGGFRPVVFLGHGLLVAFFMATVMICALALTSAKIRLGSVNNKIINSYLFFILLLCKSVGSILYGFFTLLVLPFGKPNRIMQLSILIAVLALSYPLLRATDIFPTDSVVNLAKNISKERAGSLEFRFDNENILLAHAREKLWFGWGGWGRNRVYDEQGKDLTVTDGYWIIVFGQYGLIGFLSIFGLIFYTMLLARRAFNISKEQDHRIILSAHMLLVAIIMVEQIPNDSLVPWYWLVIGALAGRANEIIEKVKQEKRNLNLSLS